jgi:lipid II:glycine glycyltransferase (peptidoglycan interpeptide bridge formation enzyme)
MKLIDVRQTKNYASFMEKIGWKVLKYKNPSFYIYIKKLPFIPLSVIKILRCPWPVNMKKLKNSLKKYKPLFIQIQPFAFNNSRKIQTGLKIAPLIPTKTIWLNLTKTKKDLLKQMKSKTRYNINLAIRKKLKVEIITGGLTNPKQLKKFYDLWKKNKPFNLIFKPAIKELKYLVSSFGNKCFFVFVYPQPGSLKNQNQLLAACLVLCSQNMVFYWHNCSADLGKKFMAPSLCIWEAIKQSKKRGFQIFDFEGIFDSQLPKSFSGWKGFTRFKQGFGGQELKFLFPITI